MLEEAVTAAPQTETTEVLSIPMPDGMRQALLSERLHRGRNPLIYPFSTKLCNEQAYTSEHMYSQVYGSAVTAQRIYTQGKVALARGLEVITSQKEGAEQREQEAQRAYEQAKTEERDAIATFRQEHKKAIKQRATTFRSALETTRALTGKKLTREAEQYVETFTGEYLTDGIAVEFKDKIFSSNIFAGIAEKKMHAICSTLLSGYASRYQISTDNIDLFIKEARIHITNKEELTATIAALIIEDHLASIGNQDDRELYSLLEKFLKDVLESADIQPSYGEGFIAELIAAYRVGLSSPDSQPCRDAAAARLRKEQELNDAQDQVAECDRRLGIAQGNLAAFERFVQTATELDWISAINILHDSTSQRQPVSSPPIGAFVGIQEIQALAAKSVTREEIIQLMEETLPAAFMGLEHLDAKAREEWRKLQDAIHFLYMQCVILQSDPPSYDLVDIISAVIEQLRNAPFTQVRNRTARNEYMSMWEKQSLQNPVFVTILPARVNVTEHPTHIPQESDPNKTICIERRSR